VRQGLSYIRHDPVLRLTVIAMSVIFIAAYNLQVMVPLVAARVLGGSSQSLGIAMSCLGLGAVTGSLIIASRVKLGLMMMAVGCGLLSFVHIWLSLLSGVYFSVAGLFLLGVSCSIFNVDVSGTLQVTVRDEVRGRVMSTYSIGILGSALIGAPLFGRLADAIGVAGTFLVIAVICAGTALAITWAWIKNQNVGVVRFAAPVSLTAGEQ
jgi:predicted MFS family arabinose efflux permease